MDEILQNSAKTQFSMLNIFHPYLSWFYCKQERFTFSEIRFAQLFSKRLANFKKAASMLLDRPPPP